VTAVADAVVPFAPPAIGAGETAEVVSALESGWLSTGPRVRQFEAAFAAYVGARHAVALNSCTAGLHLSLVAERIGAGDEVITTPLTFCATANVIIHAGATPVFADIDPETGNIDPDAILGAITPRTRAVMAVHYGGRPADVDRIGALAATYGLSTIEDAAHCIEGVVNARRIGTTADYTCFSFYATKNLTTGEGGMVTTASSEAAERLRVASLHGLSRPAWDRYERPGVSTYDVVMAGFKYNMPDVLAAIGIHQLASIDRHYDRRVAIARRYDAGLAGLPIGWFAPTPAGTVHARHLYTVLVDPATAGISRDELAARLAARGVSSSVHFPVLHLTRYYRERFGFRRGVFPAAERVGDQVLSLPYSAALTDAHVDRVIEAVHESLER
jgi:dTDP-4-amino-4,6-dideoxygalactose transaminase